jgi:hypothetical protein
MGNFSKRRFLRVGGCSSLLWRLTVAVTVGHWSWSCRESVASAAYLIKIVFVNEKIYIEINKCSCYTSSFQPLPFWACFLHGYVANLSKNV